MKMKPMILKSLASIALLALGVVIGMTLNYFETTPSAETKTAEKSDDAKAVRRAQLMMQKIKQDSEAQIANMQAQFNAEKKVYDDTIASQEVSIEELEGDLKKTKGYLNRTKKEKKAVEETLMETETTLATTQASLEDLQAEHKKKLADLKFNERQRNTLSKNLAKNNKILDATVAKNQKLYAYGKELIEIYDDPSRYDAVMRKEKFFQLKRVELENILQGKLNLMDKEHIVDTSLIR